MEYLTEGQKTPPEAKESGSGRGSRKATQRSCVALNAFGLPCKCKTMLPGEDRCLFHSTSEQGLAIMKAGRLEGAHTRTRRKPLPPMGLR
jgi:hypothetical protein